MNVGAPGRWELALSKLITQVFPTLSNFGNKSASRQWLHQRLWSVPFLSWKRYLGAECSLKRLVYLFAATQKKKLFCFPSGNPSPWECESLSQVCPPPLFFPLSLSSVFFFFFFLIFHCLPDSEAGGNPGPIAQAVVPAATAHALSSLYLA